MKISLQADNFCFFVIYITSNPMTHAACEIFYKEFSSLSLMCVKTISLSIREPLHNYSTISTLVDTLCLSGSLFISNTIMQLKCVV